MKDYKISAINNFFQEKGIPYSFANSSTTIPYTLVTINNLPIYARLANTPQSTQQGLMGVEKLDSNEGCLLDFGIEVHANLWMKNCKINLQAATVDNSGKIIDILDMRHDNPYYVHKSSNLVRYALEMNEDFFTRHGIKVGDRLRLTQY